MIHSEIIKGDRLNRSNKNDPIIEDRIQPSMISFLANDEELKQRDNELNGDEENDCDSEP
jgi:hypothetical protein